MYTVEPTTYSHYFVLKGPPKTKVKNKVEQEITPTSTFKQEAT